MANKQSRSIRKLKPKHRAVKPRPVRPLDEPKKDNHAARHKAKKVKRAAQAAEKAEREQTMMYELGCNDPVTQVEAPSEDGAFVRKFDVIDTVTGSAY